MVENEPSRARESVTAGVESGWHGASGKMRLHRPASAAVGRHDERAVSKTPGGAHSHGNEGEQLCREQLSQLVRSDYHGAGVSH
ncbi:hypothetical protein SNOG_16036 [Parastagonospora nodorum SN15]|uniref:Uncharacterized protein n=1 Tax=Phaeosphaeria nodorum (strain SN15 / ATCC MYA-4574 / FGSC 10173) TaxID=321614 RepID=Q0TWW8_PHANO|nr:hypothetical protein SNOG_16036 [Parastagonospora nodorum SN15]EAT76615.1 hypothetical protein SNOG_16036 [Parastagonospora nodorum SN15]